MIQFFKEASFYNQFICNERSGLNFEKTNRNKFGYQLAKTLGKKSGGGSPFLCRFEGFDFFNMRYMLSYLNA